VRVQFWGTRGSIAKPGPNTARYGGNTPCIELRSNRGTLVVIDGGTGAHALGRKLISSGGAGLSGSILISHTHWDHIQGLPFFEPLFAPDTEWDIYGPKSPGTSLREALGLQMEYNFFPVTLDECRAHIRFHELIEGSFEVDDIKVSTHYLNHPALTLGYRLEADGVTVVYACDHEPHSRLMAISNSLVTEQERAHIKFIDGADLLIHDGQYTAEEYPQKIGWGHSPVEYVANIGQCARVKKIALTHHDPFRDDEALDRLIATLQHDWPSLDVFAAAEGQLLELVGPAKRRTHSPGQFSAEEPVDSELVLRPVLVGVTEAELAATFSEALRAEGLSAKVFFNIDEARTLVGTERPWLVILEHDPPRIEGIDTWRGHSRPIWTVRQRPACDGCPYGE
jgi:phosphoribosyl 1,2-cyclic phosphodiesterase